MKEFQLKNELLLQAFWGGTLCKNNYLERCTGYFNNDKGDYGRGFIEFCIARNFNIHRIPGYEQFYLKDGSQMKMFYEYGKLRRSDIEDACEKLRMLYNFVQEELKNSKYVQEGKVRLVRSLTPFEVRKVTSQLRDLSKQKICLLVNIMTSYAHDGKLYDYDGKMSIVREVEVEKIIMFDECLFHPPNVCAHNIHGGEYEVWVVEDDMFGKIELDRECFKYKELDENIHASFISGASCGINASLYTDELNARRPCEYNKLTKWIIKRNQQKMMIY